MKEHFKITTLCTIILYTMVYFSLAFINWNLYNPFQWIIDLPKYSTEERGDIFSAIILYNGCLHFYTYLYLKHKTTK